MRKWAIYILNYNRPEDTVNCVDSVDIAIEQLTGAEICTKVVIDNGSNRHNLQKLISNTSSLRDWAIFSLSNNVGFAAGMNAGVTQSNSPADLYIFLNNDCQLDKGALNALADHLRCHPEEIITGFTIRDPQTGVVSVRGGHYYQPWLGIAKANLNADNSWVKQNKPLDYIDGAAFAVKSAYIKAIGGIPEQNFLYFEELLLARPLNRSTQLGFCASATVMHAGSLTVLAELEENQGHYFALKACLGYTRDTSRLMLPSVVAARLVWLGVLCFRQRSLSPLRAGARAISDSIKPNHSKST